MAQAEISITTTAIVQASTSVVVSTPVVHSTVSWRSLPHHAFKVGEHLEYAIKWSGITGGYAELTVADLVDVAQRPTYHILSTARSAGVVSALYKVQDRNYVWLDKDALVTVRYEKKIREGKFQIEESSVLDQVHHRWKTKSFRIDKNRHEEKEGDLPPHALDSFGSLYFVRTLPLEAGKSYTFDVHNGDKVYPLVVNVLKREKVKVSAGKFNCVLVEPQLRGPGIFISKGKKLQVWLTDDERRMPVRMRSEVFIGHVSADLISYRLENATEQKPAP